MKKLFYILCVLAFCSVISACRKDDGRGVSGIVGTWVNSNVSYEFRSDGSGCDKTDLSSAGLKVYVSNFKWNAGATMLHLTYDGSGNHNAGTYSYYYTIEDNVLSIWYDDGEFKGAYIKQ